MLAPAFTKTTKVEDLCRLLATTERQTWWADEIEHKVGVKSHQLSKTIAKSDRLQSAMALYDWQLVSAKDVGGTGKRKALHRVAA